MPLDEVGLVPGSYRILDLFCLREVLNQIMKCSCRSDAGFSLYQNLDEDTVFSFHCVLDIICRSCKQKVSFGSSTLVSVTNGTEGSMTRPDIDYKLSRLEICSVRSLWTTLHRPDAVPHKFEDSRINLDCNLTAETSYLNLNCPVANTSVQLECPLPEASLEFEDCITSESVTICSANQVSKSSLEEAEYTCNDTDLSTERSLPVLNDNGSIKKCPFCNKIFKKKFNLKQHLNTHTNERPLKCSQCEKRFNDRSSMNKHTRSVHANFKPHVCHECGKNFSSTSHLLEHHASHSKSKIFACNQCDKKFSFRSSLKKHSVVHVSDGLKCSENKL